MRASKSERVGSRRLLSTRRRGYDISRRSKANPATRRRDAVLRQRKRGTRAPRDIVMLVPQRLLATERELNASVDWAFGVDPEQ